jgi:hypothetical protein
MNIGKPVEVCNDFTFLHVEHHKLIGVHVRDIETAVGGIETLIVEANCGAGQRDIRDFVQRC